MLPPLIALPSTREAAKLRRELQAVQEAEGQAETRCRQALDRLKVRSCALRMLAARLLLVPTSSMHAEQARTCQEGHKHWK